MYFNNLCDYKITNKLECRMDCYPTIPIVLVDFWFSFPVTTIKRSDQKVLSSGIFYNISYKIHKIERENKRAKFLVSPDL